MEQKTFFTILKKTIREEVRNVIKQELSDILKEGLHSTVKEFENSLKELKTESVQPKRSKTKKIIKNKNKKFKDNNFADVLNETDSLTDTGTVSNYANMMNESYNDLSYNSTDANAFGMMRGNTQTTMPSVMHDPETGKDMAVDPALAKALTRDYSGLLKAMDKKKGR